MSNTNIEETINIIRKLTPNHPDYIVKKGKTFTQKQWQYNMKLAQAKENLRKKSTRLSTREQEVVSSFDDLDRLLEEESLLMYKKKWSRLGKRYKVNRLMVYYGKSYSKILDFYDEFKDKDIDYDEVEGRIKDIKIKINFNS